MVGDELTKLRRTLAWDGAELGDYFHATQDKQAVRNAVFDVICKHDFLVHATIMEKSKAYPQVRASRERFYQYGWFYHYKHLAPQIARASKELMTTAASIGTRKERASFESAVEDVMRQTVSCPTWKVNFCPAAADPCLQVADYCAWALQRKWERNDTRSYDLIKSRVGSEYDLWARGTKHHY